MEENVTLPEGFVLDDGDNGLPEGFVLDNSEVSPLQERMTPAQVIRGAATGRIDRAEAENYLKSVGMDPAAIDRFGQDASGLEIAGGLMQKPAQGASFGFSEEATAAALAPLMAGKEGLTYTDARNAIQEEMRRQGDIASVRHPYLSTGMELGGGVATGIGAYKAAPNVAEGVSKFAAKGFIPRVATSAGVGAVSGGLYAAGTSEGDLQQRAEQGASGAKFGAGLGVALPAAGATIGPLTRKVSSMLAKRQKVPTGSLQQIAESAGDYVRSDSAPEKIVGRVGKAVSKEYGPQANEVVQTLKKGDGALLDTYSSKIRQLAKGSAQYAGGQEVMEDFFSKRIPKTYDDIQASIGRNISSDASYYATADDIANAGRAKAGPLYEKAYEHAIPTKYVDDILSTPSGRSALREASVKMQNDMAVMAKPDLNLSKQAKAMGVMSEGGVAKDLNVRSLDYIKRAMDDQIRRAKKDAPDDVRIITGLKNKLLSVIDDRVPIYKQARAESGDYLRLQNAMDMGKDFMKKDPELLAKEFKALSEAEKTAYRSGVGKNIRDIMDKAKEGRNPYAAVIGSPANQKRLATILSPEQYKNFLGDMKATDRIFKLRNEILGGSPTASKQIAAKEVADMGMAIASSGQSGILSAMSTFVRKAFDGLNDKTARQLAEIITEERPEKKMALFDAMNKGKILTREERDLAKKAFVITQKAFDEYRAGGAVAGGISGGSIPQDRVRIDITKDRDGR